MPIHTVGTTTPTECSSEILLMWMIELKKLIVVFLMNMKSWNTRLSSKADLVWQFVWRCCWYLKFFAPIWNVNFTVCTTETQFIPGWFWLIKPHSWMFWCKSVIRGLWEGFEIKAKQLCPDSPCSYVQTEFDAFAELQNFVYWSSTCPLNTNESLFGKWIILLFVFALVLHCSLHFSFSRRESDSVCSLLVGMRQDS